MAQAREGQADEDRLAEEHVEQGHEAFAPKAVRRGETGEQDAEDEQEGKPVGLPGHVARRRDCQPAPAEDQTGQNGG